MDFKHIAELNPELPARDSIQFKAAVTLIWPFSSSQRQFALLLAEPEFRLRRKKGQVRARFHGSSAKALATTGVGIGDEVVLGLRGAQFVQEDTVSTPGRSIDWELQYNQTVSVQVFRNGSQIADLELVDVAPTPAARSPVRMQSTVAPSPAHQWSSPAFLKRVRLSDGPFFEAPYDPSAEDHEDSHDTKRRRKSYRDWTAWTYSARTPSPGKEDVSGEDDLNDVEASPSRPTQLPHTPVSPPKPGKAHVLLDGHDSEDDSGSAPEVNKNSTNAAPVREQDGATAYAKAATKWSQDDLVRLNQNYDLYAGPDELPPSEAPYAFGGDTEVNTEEDDDMQDTDGVSMSATEANTEELVDEHVQTFYSNAAKATTSIQDQPVDTLHAGSSTEEDSVIEVVDENVGSTYENVQSSTIDHTVQQAKAPVVVMPPPTLSALNTNFAGPITSGLLTPIGREPASPTLQPLDSATLPLPSPFPGGERDVGISSYLDHVPSSGQPAETGYPTRQEIELPSDADYIGENSFFSSISSSKTPSRHPDHETAFTPVRFTFGLDGAGFSRPMELSSPIVADIHKDIDEADQQDMDPSEDLSIVDLAEVDVQATIVAQDRAALYQLQSRDVGEVASEKPLIDIALTEPIATRSAAEVSQGSKQEQDATEPELIDLSSGSEAADSDQNENEEDTAEDHRSIAKEEIKAADLPVEDEINVDAGELTEVDLEDLNQTSLERIPAPENEVSYPEIEDDHDFHSQPNQDRPATTPEVDTFAEFVNLGSSPGTRRDAEHHISDLVTSPPLNSAPIDPTHSGLAKGFDGNDADMLDQSLPTEDALLENASLYPTLPEEVPDTDIERATGSQHIILEGHEPQMETSETDVIMTDDFPQKQAVDITPPDVQREHELHPDIKLESIEEDVPVAPEGRKNQLAQDGNEEDIEVSAGDMLIEVPDQDHELGELHTIAVPATGPARNTRSKTKPSASPTKEETRSSKRTTRSTRSKASVASVTRTTLSPPVTQDRSTMSPAQELKQTSPYSLRSQSKQMSPTESMSGIVGTTSRNTRRHASQKSVDFGEDPFTLQSSKKNAFEPEPSSTEPDASRERRKNVSIKDVLEEHSPKPEWNTFTNLSDPIEGSEADLESTALKPPPSPASAPKTRAGAKAKLALPQNDTSNIQSSPTRSERPISKPSSPRISHRRLRSAGSTASVETTPPSPRFVRTLRRRDQDQPSTPPRDAEGRGEDEIIADARVVPVLSPGDGSTMGSSPPPEIKELPANQRSLLDSHRPLTPDATQRTNNESQVSVSGPDQQQTLPTTPQLTQARSGLRSFNKGTESPSFNTEVSQVSPVPKSTPRHNASQTDVASSPTTPKEHSPDVSSDTEPTKIVESENPTIGLSTRVAYYTPLNSLSYFLNRSSQFHTASNPDILALVTSPTTPPQRATKGPKHWNTILHITDASLWPQHTTITVNIFRAYQSALPHADAGDVILLRAFAVKSLNRQPTLISADESAWCVWRYAKPVWGSKRGAFGEVKAREEVKGPEVERGEGEWKEVGKIRAWFEGKVKRELEEMEKEKVHTRSRDKVVEEVEVNGEVEKEKGVGHRHTRSRDNKVVEETSVANGVGDGDTRRHTRSQDKGKEKA